MLNCTVFVLISVPDDGGGAGRGTETGGDATHVPRMQRIAAHHRRRVDGHSFDTGAAARQERLAGQRFGKSTTLAAQSGWSEESGAQHGNRRFQRYVTFISITFSARLTPY